MNRDMYCEKFLKLRGVRDILGENYILTNLQKIGLSTYFDLYGYRKSQDHYPRLANFISQGHDGYVELEKKLLTHNRMSEEYFCILYGGILGKERWDNNIQKIMDCLPSRIEYWMKKGLSCEDANEEVLKHQKHASVKSRKACKGKERELSVRCIEYWIKRGYDEEIALTLVSGVQTRGLPYFIEKYGAEKGKERYSLSCQRRKTAWANKTPEERHEHYLKTIPKSFNPVGQEIQAILLFIKQNGIDTSKCMYGAPSDQFYQYIPDVGFRRYDLAVFNDVYKKDLRCIMEFHGPGHVNFSDYTAILSSESITINGKILEHLGTYGDSVRNDHNKRNHIIKNYPEADYYVFWNTDLKNKDLKIK